MVEFIIIHPMKRLYCHLLFICVVELLITSLLRDKTSQVFSVADVFSRINKETYCNGQIQLTLSTNSIQLQKPYTVYPRIDTTK